jgi:hypothetical protein
MKSRTPISLFPFLSVLVSTMGVLSLLAVTFSLFAGPEGRSAAQARSRPVDVRWVGAPDYVRPLLVECRANGALVHAQPGEPPRFFSTEALQHEATIVRQLQEEGMGRLGLAMGRQTLWVYFKSVIADDRRLKGSLTLALHELEMSNLSGKNRERREEHYPILLVYPDGIETFDQVTYLVETTSRLSTGVEPMLPGWTVPYQRRAS